MDLALGLRTLAVNATSGWYAPAYTEPMDSILLLATDHTSALPSRFDGYPDTPTAVQAEMENSAQAHAAAGRSFIGWVVGRGLRAGPALIA